MHIFLSGEKHIGKSTVVSEVVKHFKCAGLLSVSEINNSVRKAYLRDFNLGFNKSVHCGTCVCAHVTERLVSAFDVFGVQVLSAAAQSADLVVIDEIGNMEADAKLYSQFIKQILSRPFPVVLSVLQNMAHSELAKEIREMKNIVWFNIDENNRNSISNLIVRRLEDEMLCKTCDR